jgi:hypothetical protein
MSTKYDQAYAVIAERLYRETQATDEQVARVLDVDRGTIEAWAREYPEFREARARGKEDADAQVKAALFKRAVGYTATKEKVVGFEGQFWTEEYHEHVAGDVIAQIFWLCNRQPKHWRQKQVTEHEVSQPITLAYSLPPAPTPVTDEPEENKAIDVTDSVKRAA